MLYFSTISFFLFSPYSSQSLAFFCVSFLFLYFFLFSFYFLIAVIIFLSNTQTPHYIYLFRPPLIVLLFLRESFVHLLSLNFASLTRCRLKRSQETRPRYKYLLLCRIVLFCNVTAIYHFRTHSSKGNQQRKAKKKMLFQNDVDGS